MHKYIEIYHMNNSINNINIKSTIKDSHGNLIYFNFF